MTILTRFHIPGWAGGLSAGYSTIEEACTAYRDWSGGREPSDDGLPVVPYLVSEDSFVGAAHPLLTFAGTVAWVESHLSPDRLRQMGHDTPLNALCWWLAYQAAEEAMDCNRRELADLFRNGFDGYKTAEDVQGWLDDHRKDFDNNEEAEVWVENALTEFFLDGDTDND